MGVIAHGSFHETHEYFLRTLEFERTRIQECNKVYLVNIGCSINVSPQQCSVEEATLPNP